MPFKSSDSLLPLTPISFEVLLALMNGELTRSASVVDDDHD